MLFSFFSPVFRLAFVLIVCLSLTSAVQAERPSDLEVDRVCHNWVAYVAFHGAGWADIDDVVIESMRPISVNDTVMAYYAEIAPQGYVLVPALMELAPIMAYSDKYRVDWESDVGQAALLREVLAFRMKIVVETYGSLEATSPDKGDMLQTADNRAAWKRFSVSSDEFTGELSTKNPDDYRNVGPLLTSVWHQYSPYNLLCPDGDGDRCVVGCVATSAAQILDYYEWPPEGYGTRQYYWVGDYSCEGSSPGEMQFADLNDAFDWDNILDECEDASPLDEINAMSELCYEVGVAYSMDYGACGSAAFTSDGETIYPDRFRYLDQIERHDRKNTTQQYWSDMIEAEIEAGRPIHYQIHTHAIVCDGWRELGGFLQVHMNYGWGGPQNMWYTIDQLHCPWEGCDYMKELMLTNIVPDKRAVINADTTWGQVPLDVQYTGSSSFETVDDWNWVFGDGDASGLQSPLHTYTEPGCFDVSLYVVGDGDVGHYPTVDYIIALADTLSSLDCQAEAGQTVEVSVYASNTLPLDNMKFQVSYSGDLMLNFSSFSTEGCRSDIFDVKSQVHLDTWNRRMSFNFYNSSEESPSLEPGSGVIAKLYFAVAGSAQSGQSTTLTLDGYGSYTPLFNGSILDYVPILNAGTVSIANSFVCGDANGDEDINLLDILYLIDFVYGSPTGPAPEPPEAGDVDGDSACNLLDILYLIDYLYGNPTGPAPVCP